MSEGRLLPFLMGQLYDRFYKTVYSPFGIARIRSYDRRIHNFIELLQQDNAVGVGQYPWRILDLLWMLETFRPKVIQELGSGTSTAVFAAYACKTGRQVVTHEESPQWFEINLSNLRRCGLAGEWLDYRRLDVVETEGGTRFEIPIRQDADLVYVDGPYCKKLNGQRYANLDIVSCLQQGSRPRVIAVDGRWKTIDALLALDAMKDYRFIRNASSAAQRGDFRDFLGFHHHSLFVRRDAT